MVPKRSGILDPQDPGSGILEDLGSYIFIFSWDLRYLRSCYGNMAMGSLGSRISDRKDSAGSWRYWILLEQVVVGSCRFWTSQNNNVTVFLISFTSNEFFLLVPLSMGYLNLSTVKNFKHTLIQPFCVDVKTSSPCWYLQGAHCALSSGGSIFTAVTYPRLR